MVAARTPEDAARRAWRATQRLLTDPRTIGVAQAAPRTVAFMARQRERSVGLAAGVLLDEVLISAMRNPRLFPRGDDFARAGADMRDAQRMWHAAGWLEDPASYHRDPGVPAVDLAEHDTLTQRYEQLSFDSGYQPHPGEPGRDRWLGHIPNRTAHATLLRHRGSTRRPWVVCIHGFGMGRGVMDARAFRARRLYQELGVNVALPVLPMHGRRQDPGTQMGEGFMSIDLIDSVHGMAQAAWDVRSLIRWIRSQHGDVPVGVYGISLGGYVTALVASLEEGLACAVAGIPATDMPELFRRHSPPAVRRRAFEAGALGPDADAVHSVVSPLALRPLVPRERRFVFAGIGDRMSTSAQARRLWEHWDRPEIAWYHGGHVGFFLAGNVTEFVTGALRRSGLSASTPAT